MGGARLARCGSGDLLEFERVVAFARPPPAAAAIAFTHEHILGLSYSTGKGRCVTCIFRYLNSFSLLVVTQVSPPCARVTSSNKRACGGEAFLPAFGLQGWFFSGLYEHRPSVYTRPTSRGPTSTQTSRKDVPWTSPKAAQDLARRKRRSSRIYYFFTPVNLCPFRRFGGFSTLSKRYNPCSCYRCVTSPGPTSTPG